MTALRTKPMRAMSVSQEPKQKIVVIVGPTASGKTALAVALAKRFSGEVISADSRQIYRGLDIGTEKITKEEMGSVPHHLIDIADPEQAYTAAEWNSAAVKAITEIAGRGNLPIVAGGTFFYIETLLGLELPNVPPNPTLRTELEKLSPEELYTMLLKRDPERAESIDRHNPRRLIRALEIIEALGSVPKLAPTAPYDALIIGIETDRTELRNRIATRLRETLEKGLIEETQRLLREGVPKERLNEIGLEYRVIMEYLNGSIEESRLLPTLEEKVWQYAKRQLTWLARTEHIRWYKREDVKNIEKEVEGFLKK